ncbi:hypothetical protein CIPAW_04G037500 [Carya illinoinensis]|uniref:Uncharacterized protein n=1 Tax=Carya illinoinensis TaxID=32201 RepID=A0A8T1QQF5_CARIL|nr:hypothetical protein CIPAW_04G037500 [Carya illinoinensis]
MADWGPVVIAVVLFVLLTPGLLFQLPGNSRVVEFANMQTSESFHIGPHHHLLWSHHYIPHRHWCSHHHRVISSFYAHVAPHLWFLPVDSVSNFFFSSRPS